MKIRVAWMTSVVAACFCMSCSGGVLDLNDIDVNSSGEIAFGDVDIQWHVDLPGEAVVPECETHEDCQGNVGDLDACEIALCDSVQHVCVVEARKNYTPCDDDDACTYESFCLDGICGGGSNYECTDGNECTDDSCDPATGCAFVNNAVACDDGNECTSGDVCSAGICFGQPGECPCESNLDCQMVGGDLCSYDEMDCVDGFCTVTGAVDVLCDNSQDGQCLKNLCNPATGECELEELGGTCSDGSTCTVGDVCQAGDCLPGANKCECESDMDCAGFEDGNLCNGTLACIEGLCAADPATLVVCSDDGLGQCEVSKCNPATGVCGVAGKSDGVVCDDGDACTATDVCINGLCLGSAGSCDDGNDCTEDTCSADGGCLNAPLSDVACDDGNACTGGDLCVEGACVGGENVCGDCGDSVCGEGESCESCPDDCGLCGDCCAIQEGPGCADEAVQACTCALDAFCCESVWDDICIEEAVAECGLTCGTEPECGDSLCDESESCESCPADCGECPAGCCEPAEGPGCADGEVQVCVCELDAYCCETAWDDICVAEVEEYGCGDCGGAGGCGDGLCVEPEACFNCPEDCGVCAKCGDGDCGPLESCEACPEDCGVCPTCGDANCDDDEDCKSCPGDCGECCGNDSCEALYGEDCETCAADCGECPDACGDDACGEGESCGNCPADCGECEGSCCIPNATPGCQDQLVQECVCAVDQFCCLVSWDELCAGEADECGSCNGDCCKNHPGPGCMDEEIEACICAADAFCCDVAWDGLCVAEVSDLECGTCEVVPVCGDNQCHGAEDCKSCPADCGDCCGNGACEALLGEDCGNCPGDCGECPAACGDGVCGDDENCVSCPSDCGKCTGSCCLSNGTAGCTNANVQGCVCAQDPYCCNVQWDGLCASEADECGSCDGDCCTTNGNAGCEEEPIEACVCAADPYCCNVNWDNLCVNEVESLDCGTCEVANVCGDGVCAEAETCGSCPNDCGECAGGCCEAHDGTGCDDLVCVDFICEIDAYCCEESWDDLCATEAADYCPVCDGVLPFCGDGQCLLGETCDTCPQDCGKCPFCGDGECGDDEDCKSCAADCGACDSDCCIVHDGQGCDDGDCTDIVCEMDSYCCNNTWDSICAQEAGALCPVCGGDVPVCGDKVCGSGETCSNCPGDCGVCPPECGDAECNGDEDCVSCAEDCGACQGNCCESNGGVGCETPSCQDAVCAADAWCCNNEWDNICADEAAELCIGCMDVGNCCAIDHGTGCENQAVQDCVCAIDAWCCNNAWDNICVTEAQNDCGANCELANFCGDQVCSGDEDCVSCEVDCGACCGDGICEAALGEDCGTCEADCGACCGDDVCDADMGEDCETCAADCGACPVASTCAERCSEFDADLACQCDSLCFSIGDCCQDVCTECADSDFPDQCGAITDTCKFRCGEYEFGKNCQCDSVCFAANDCCDDVCDNCSADYPQQCP